MKTRIHLALLCLPLALACQRIEEPTPTPTTDQWRRVQENLLDELPEGVNRTDATFDGRIRLVGWEIDPQEVEVGAEVELTLYWEALTALDDRWWIFIHLDSNTRQNLDHEAIDDLYPTVYWEPGDIIRDRVTTTLSNDVTSEEVQILVGLFQGDDRMAVTDPGSGTLEEDGRLRVGAFPASWNAPEYTIRRATGAIQLDGRPTDRAWSRAQRTGNWTHPNTGEAVEGLNTWGKLLWDDEYLYVLMNARDTDIWSTLTERDADLWNEEVLELYLDVGGDGRDYLELQVNPLNTVFDARFADAANRDLPAARAIDVDGLETAVYVSGQVENREDRDRSWSVEMRIPLASIPGLELPVSDSTDLHLNFYRYDRPDDGTVNTAAWSTVGGGTFHNPARFGRATFEPAPEPSADGSGDEAEEQEATGPTRLHLNNTRRLGRQPSGE